MSITACACLGPQFGEPFCPCQMEGRERSAEYNEYMLPENVDKRRQELNQALAKVFGWNKEEENEKSNSLEQG